MSATSASAAPRLPRHVAIIMDGNGRWAEARGGTRVSGHQAGLEAVRAIIRHCTARGVAALTLFAFSSENWRRPASEVAGLMELFFEALQAEVDELHRNGVRLRFIGERAALAGELQGRMAAAERRTAANSRLSLQVALSYGGRADIVSAAARLAGRCAAGALRSADIDEARFAAELALGELPDPDLFIRTGGERRVSNFLLWNLAYTELYFCDTLWPDFGTAEFDQALAHYAQRERRFGLTGQQARESAA